MFRSSQRFVRVETAPNASAVPRPTTQALRTASAATLCLAVVAVFHLAHGNLAVWTTYMVMTQYPFTMFQKGIERIIGRGLGILAGLVLLTLFRNAWGPGYLCEALSLAIFFYVYFCGRLSYTFLNAGLYLAVITNFGHADYAAAFPVGGELFLAVVVGVAIADLVVWFTRAESDLRIQTLHAPLWPLDPDRCGRSLLLVATVSLTQIVTTVLQLPQDTALVSVMVLMIAPDMQSMIRKGKLRIAGALLAIAFGSVSLVLLSRIPHFPLLLGLLFLGIYLAAYLAATGGANSYAGVQMGLVLPMILVVHPEQVTSLAAAGSRGLGVFVALAASLLVGGVSMALFPAAKTLVSPAPGGNLRA